jgi:hypothetical protein
VLSGLSEFAFTGPPQEGGDHPAKGDREHGAQGASPFAACAEKLSARGEDLQNLEKDSDHLEKPSVCI